MFNFQHSRQTKPDVQRERCSRPTRRDGQQSQQQQQHQQQQLQRSRKQQNASETTPKRKTEIDVSGLVGIDLGRTLSSVVAFLDLGGDDVRHELYCKLKEKFQLEFERRRVRPECQDPNQPGKNILISISRSNDNTIFKGKKLLEINMFS